MSVQSIMMSKADDSTPQRRSLENLDKSLTPTRRRVANEILLWLNNPDEQDKRSHALVVGPPGSGKSHILSYLEKIISQYQENKQTIIIQEETRSILSLFDFIISCLRYCETISPETIVETLQSRSPEPLVAIQHLFDEFATGKPTAIFIEDFSDLFDNMDEADRDQMKAFFAKRPHVTLIASSINTLDEKQIALGTMSRMFNIRRLPNLSLDETSSFLGRILLDKKRLPPKLMNAFQNIHHLTDANPGLMENVGRFLVDFDDRALDTAFVPIATELLIPFYAERIQHLEQDQLSLLREIARRRGRAATSDELVETLAVPQESMQKLLQQLYHQDVLSRVKSKTDTYYEINEPFFRAFLEFGNDAIEFLEPTMHFISAWFKVERRRQTFKLPRPQIDPDQLAGAVTLFAQGNQRDAMEIFDEIHSIEPSNPILVSHVFRHRLNDNTTAAFAFLAGVLSASPMELNHPVELLEHLIDIFKGDTQQREHLLNIYRENNTFILQSLIHRFMTANELQNSDVLGDVREIVEILAPDISEMALLAELERQYRIAAQKHDKAMRDIPIEFRKLVQRHDNTPG